jgi:hypothetical protein
MMEPSSRAPARARLASHHDIDSELPPGQYPAKIFGSPQRVWRSSCPHLWPSSSPDALGRLMSNQLIQSRNHMSASQGLNAHSSREGDSTLRVSIPPGTVPGSMETLRVLTPRSRMQPMTPRSRMQPILMGKPAESERRHAGPISLIGTRIPKSNWPPIPTAFASYELAESSHEHGEHASSAHSLREEEGAEEEKRAAAAASELAARSPQLDPPSVEASYFGLRRYLSTAPTTSLQTLSLPASYSVTHESDTLTGMEMRQEVGVLLGSEIDGDNRV